MADQTTTAHAPYQSQPRTSFRHQPTPLYLETVALLRRLHTAEDSDAIHSAWADVAAADHLAAFARTRHVRQRRDGHGCVRRLVGKRCQRCDCPQIPAGDHLSEWCRGCETVAIVSQPYGLYDKQLEETMAFCAHYGLSVTIDAWPSWHFPGSVLTVVFTRQGFDLQAAPTS